MITHLQTKKPVSSCKLVVSGKNISQIPHKFYHSSEVLHFWSIPFKNECSWGSFIGEPISKFGNESRLSTLFENFREISEG